MLERLFHATGGPNWINQKNWLSFKPLSCWHGISATADTVTELNLGSNNLNGENYS
jgi:hypothetical protein